MSMKLLGCPLGLEKSDFAFQVDAEGLGLDNRELRVQSKKTLARVACPKFGYPSHRADIYQSC